MVASFDLELICGLVFIVVPWWLFVFCLGLFDLLASKLVELLVVCFHGCLGCMDWFVSLFMFVSFACWVVVLVAGLMLWVMMVLAFLLGCLFGRFVNSVVVCGSLHTAHRYVSLFDLFGYGALCFAFVDYFALVF